MTVNRAGERPAVPGGAPGGGGGGGGGASHAYGGGGGPLPDTPTLQYAATFLPADGALAAAPAGAYGACARRSVRVRASGRSFMFACVMRSLVAASR
jgi:hypothetical protein